MSDYVMSADGVPIYYDVHGDGTVTLIFVHDFFCDRSYWENQIGYFSQKYKVVALDLAGHGESGIGRKHWTVPTIADDIVSVIDKLALQRVVLIGDGESRDVILEAACRIPGRLLGLLGVGFAYKQVKATSENDIASHIAFYLDEYSSLMRQHAEAGIWDQDANPQLVEKAVKSYSAVPQEVGIEIIQAVLRYELTPERFHEVNAPIVQIEPESWPYFESIAGLVQYYDVETLSMSSSSRYLMIDDPETFNRLVEEALEKFSL